MMAPREPRPPLLGKLLLRLRRLGPRRQEIEADLRELFRQRVAERGRWYAALRYCADAASLWIHRADSAARPSRQRGREIHSQQHGGMRGGWGLFEGLLLDIRFAVRTFRRQIGAVSVTVAGLALAIGTTSVVFGVVNATMLPPIGGLGPHASSVVEVARISPSGGRLVWLSYEWYQQLRDAARLVYLEAYHLDAARLGETEGESALVTLVTGGFFETLSVGAEIGRVLTDADDAPGAAPAVVINYNVWKNRYGGDESIVGQTVRLMGTPFTVVGVIEEGFVGPSFFAFTAAPAFWVPLSTYGAVWRGQPTMVVPQVWVVGRIREGTTREQAEAEVSALVVALEAEESGGERGEGFRARLEPAGDYLSDPELRWVLAVTLGVLGLVLLLACTNVANLLLAGAIARRREVGMRLALGASRGRVVRQLLTESVLLGALGGGLGLLLAVSLLPFAATLGEVPPTIEMAPDIRVYVFVVSVTLLAGVLAGLAPARYGVRGDLASPLKGDVAVAGRSARPGRIRSVLVATQAAASIVLLILAALLTRATVHVARSDLGFDADRLVTVRSPFGPAGYDVAAAADYWERALETIASLPGVERAALAEHPPFGRGYHQLRVHRAGREYRAGLNDVSADYFATVGIPVLRGRSFNAAEVATDAPVVVISERLARWWWEDADPIGMTLGSGGLEDLPEDLSNTRVIGVVADTVTRLEDPQGSATIYRPLAPGDALVAGLVVRARGDAVAIAGPLVAAIRALDPAALPMATTVRDGVRNARAELRILATTARTLGVIALGLAITGIFGLTAFAVEQRTGEIGVRLAVGANARDVVGLMLRDSLRPVAAGLIVGLLLALAAGRIIAALLYGISPHDPLSIAAAVAVLLGAAALAAAVPTRRATQVDPAVVLRSE
jgi:predicted permease